MSFWWFLPFSILILGAFLILMALNKTADEVSPTHRAAEDLKHDVQPEITGLQADIAEVRNRAQRLRRPH